MNRLFCVLLLIVCTFKIQSAEKKTIEIHRIDQPLTIDGILDEQFYKQALPAKDFTQIEPYNGKPSYQPSEVYFFYDQTAIYVGAMLYDSAPDSIFNYLSQRDEFGISDYFGVYIDPYNQGQLAYGFFITPAGVQMDMKAVRRDYDNEDGSWNAVWDSKTMITDKGWVVEMRIPFSALRFSEKSGSTWGLNMFRQIRRYSSNNSWNFVDRNIDGFIHQEGQMSGIVDVKPPVRLSLSPYAATYFESNKAENTNNFLYKGGLDVKYGINESFTLDMMLVPDFGQIQSDDKRLNLSPYEIYYDEKRQFFTEGTELFQRGNIFYSRRIGANPKFSASDSLRTNEVVDFNPSETQLVNATKISGRTSNDWGLGMLNAMSLNSYATLKDTLTGATRKEIVQPFTNYNVAVIDKSLKNNSYISLINTNVSMADNSFMANVTATEFQIRDKSKTYALKGKGGISARGENANEKGGFTDLGIEKNSGKIQAGLYEYIYTDKYNPNDLGYLRNNNKVITEAWLYYQEVQPVGILKDYNGNVWWNYKRMYKPNAYFDNEWGYNLNLNFTNNYWFNSNGGIATDKYDYYETRVLGRYFFVPYLYWYNFNLNTDGRKRLSFYFHYGHTVMPNSDFRSHYGDFSTTLRVGQRLKFGYSLNFSNNYNEYGFVEKNDNEDTIYFAKRDVKTLVNVFSTTYVINNKAGITLRARHYWSGNKNKKYYLLTNNGRLDSNTSYSDNNDQNFNAFTIDMSFSWIFKPGSELVFAWKSSAYGDDDHIVYSYGDNLKNSFLNRSNSLSLKVLYYIDYNNLRKKKV